MIGVKKEPLRKLNVPRLKKSLRATKAKINKWDFTKLKRNEMEVFVMRWMELESVIQSEASQKEKNKYSVLTHIYGI